MSLPTYCVIMMSISGGIENLFLKKKKRRFLMKYVFHNDEIFLKIQKCKVRLQSFEMIIRINNTRLLTGSAHGKRTRFKFMINKRNIFQS